jgi:glycosyltransferase involved in cell wall biosynthesis
MKILMLASWYPNEVAPTNGNFIEKHCEAIALKHEVSLIYFEPNPTAKKSSIVNSELNGVKRVGLIYPKVTSNLPIISSLLKLYIQYRLIKRIQSTIRWNEIDLVHLHVCLPYGIWAYWLAKKHKKKLFVTEHSSAFHQQRFSGINNYFIRKILGYASKISTVSEDLGKSIQTHFNVNSSTLSCIPNVVNENYFYVNQTAKQRVKHKFIHISNAVEKAKNIVGILEAIRLLSIERTDFELKIVSDGDTSYLNQFIEDNNLQQFIHIEGTKTTSEIAKLIQQSDTLVLFSNYENFPCVIAEAWMCGVPVISTAVNGIPEFANSQNSILIEKGNDLALKNALLNRMNIETQFDPFFISTKANELFSYQSVAEKFDAFYKS